MGTRAFPILVILFQFSTLSFLLSLDYQGSFQSCFHFGDSYRMEQSVSGVHLPADSHGYTSHQHNGFHMSSTSGGSAAGETLGYITSTSSFSSSSSDISCASLSLFSIAPLFLQFSVYSVFSPTSSLPKQEVSCMCLCDKAIHDFLKTEF